MIHAGDESALRPLDLPRRLRVRTDTDNRPAAVKGRRGLVRIEAIRETWQIDDEWWRSPISRVYHTVVLEGGRLITLFYDQIDDEWYLQ